MSRVIAPRSCAEGAPQPPGGVRLTGQGILLGLLQCGTDLQQIGHGCAAPATYPALMGRDARRYRP
jgi:hypothetical protein